MPDFFLSESGLLALPHFLHVLELVFFEQGISPAVMPEVEALALVDDGAHPPAEVRIV
jgi:hypothetical protein